MMARKAKDQREKEHLHWQETFRVFTTPRYFITNIMGPPLTLFKVCSGITLRSVGGAIMARIGFRHPEAIRRQPKAKK